MKGDIAAATRALAAAGLMLLLSLLSKIKWQQDGRTRTTYGQHFRILLTSQLPYFARACAPGEFRGCAENCFFSGQIGKYTGISATSRAFRHAGRAFRRARRAYRVWVHMKIFELRNGWRARAHSEFLVSGGSAKYTGISARRAGFSARRNARLLRSRAIRQHHGRNAFSGTNPRNSRQATCT